MREFDNDSENTSQLLLRANAGEAEAFQQLVMRHLPVVRDLVRRRMRPKLQARLDRSDIVQDTQTVAFQRFQDYLERRPMPFRLWLLKTAHERILMAERAHIRAAKRTVDREVPMPDLTSQRPVRHLPHGPQSAVQIQEQAKCVRQCIAKLSDAYREILELRFFHQLTNGEAAELLEITPDSARKRFARALLKLKNELKRAGIESCAT